MSHLMSKILLRNVCLKDFIVECTYTIKGTAALLVDVTSWTCYHLANTNA